MGPGDRKQRIKGRGAVAESIFEIANRYNLVDMWRHLHQKKAIHMVKEKIYSCVQARLLVGFKQVTTEEC